jgi:large subunit ribosomal protein L11
MIIKLLIDGGDMKPGPAVAQQLGPMGVNMGKVISDVNEATKEFKGMKVPVEVNIDEKTKEFSIKTSSPPASELLKKELNVEKGTADHKNIKVGNASIEDVIKVAKVKHPSMLEKNLKNAVKSILGTCTSVGLLVENKSPKEVLEDIEKGTFDNEINAEKTETDSEKRKKINDYFATVKAEQDAKIEQEKKEAQDAKLEEEKKAAEALEKGEGKTEGSPEKKTEEVKKEEKK